MEWTQNHDVLLCRELIAFDVFQFKAGSRERGQCFARISEILKCCVEVEHTELDDLCQDLIDRRDKYERDFAEASCSKAAKINEEQRAAEEVRLIATERLSESLKRKEKDSDGDGTSPTQKKRRSSGGDTIAFLREKSEREFQLREREMELRRQELELSRLNSNGLLELVTRLTDKLAEKPKQ